MRANPVVVVVVVVGDLPNRPPHMLMFFVVVCVVVLVSLTVKGGPVKVYSLILESLSQTLASN